MGYWVASLGVRPDSWFMMLKYVNWEKGQSQISTTVAVAYIADLSSLPFPLGCQETIVAES